MTGPEPNQADRELLPPPQDLRLPRADASLAGVVQGSVVDQGEPGPPEIEAFDFPHIIRALQNPQFRFFWASNFLSNIGTWMQNVAQGWLVLQLSNSPFWLGVVGFAASVPMLLFALLGGVIADHVDRRRFLFVTQSVMMALAFVMAALAYFQVITVPQIAVLAFLTGVAMALNLPSYQALVPQLVPRDDLQNAIALNAAQFNMSRVLGPTLGGFAMAAFGPAGNFVLNGFSFMSVLFALRRLRLPERQPELNGGTLWQKLADGFRYVFGMPDTRALVILMSVVSLFAIPYLTFLPYFVRDILHGTERELGILMACGGTGAFLAAAMIASMGRHARRGRIVLIAGMTFAASIILFSFSRVFVLSCVIQFCSGYTMVMMVATTNTLFQQLTSDQMRGRVMSIYATAFLGLPPLGALLAGSLARHMAPERAIAGMAAIALIGLAAVLFTQPRLRELS